MDLIHWENSANFAEARGNSHFLGMRIALKGDWNNEGNTLGLLYGNISTVHFISSCIYYILLSKLDFRMCR